MGKGLASHDTPQLNYIDQHFFTMAAGDMALPQQSSGESETLVKLQYFLKTGSKRVCHVTCWGIRCWFRTMIKIYNIQMKPRLSYLTSNVNPNKFKENISNPTISKDPSLHEVNLTLDERLACGRDDRPLRRSVREAKWGVIAATHPEARMGQFPDTLQI